MKTVVRKRRIIYSVVILTISVVVVAWICRPLPADEVAAMLEATTIPHVSFKDATFEGAIDEILARAAEQNPRIHQIRTFFVATNPEPSFTVDLVNIPASEALKEVSALAHLKYTIRPGAIGFYPIWFSSAPPFTPLEKAEWRWKIFIIRLRDSFGWDRN